MLDVDFFQNFYTSYDKIRRNLSLILAQIASIY